MSDPLFYILAPFGLAFALFALYLVVALILRDPTRPFRMFAARPLDKADEEAGEDQEDEKEGDPETGNLPRGEE
ncbi:MAG: hypothetical protein JSV00_00200 [bacterium]|nr:MAG: hypothetical protein JSV00_00200 [bacterium]